MSIVRWEDQLPRFKENKDDKAFLRWIRTLSSCLDGDGPCEACHVRRASKGAGTGIKPAFYAIPLTHSQHLMQHTHGELACLQKYVPQVSWTLLSAKWFFDNEATKLRMKWLEKLAGTA